VPSQGEAGEVVTDVFPRNRSPHFATGQTAEVSPCVGWQSSLKYFKVQIPYIYVTKDEASAACMSDIRMN
jgi:hypothetical protein